MKDKNYKVQGFLAGERQVQKQTVSAKDLVYTPDGYMLDEIQIQATITSRSEIEYLIKFLQTSTPCFK